MAIGAGTPIGIDGEDRSADVHIKKGLNSSSVQEDFMFGSEDLKCTATTREDYRIIIIENGEIII